MVVGRRRLAVALASLTLPVVAALPLAAQTRTLTTADYDRAVKMLAQNVNNLVVGGTVNPTFLPDGSFWYRAVRPEGSSFLRFDPAKRTTAP